MNPELLKRINGLSSLISNTPFEPASSPTLSIGYRVGKHRIQGISDEFIPPIVKLTQLDKVVSVDDGDAIVMAQKLANEMGIGVGISSGANFIGALKLQNEMGSKSVVVTVFPDDNKKYLSTDLSRDEKIKDDFLSKDIKLLGFKAFKRVCPTCCNPEECIETLNLDVQDIINLPECPIRRK